MRMFKILLMVAVCWCQFPVWSDMVPPSRLTNSKVYVTFYANGGVGKMPPQKVSRYGSCKIKANKFSRPGYIFAGWRDMNSGERFDDGDQIYVYLGRDLVAQWQVDEWSWLDHASVLAGTALDVGEREMYPVVIVKVAKRNKKTKIAKVSVSVKFPGKKSKVTFKGTTSDGYCYLEGKGCTGDIQIGDGFFHMHTYCLDVGCIEGAYTDPLRNGGHTFYLTTDYSIWDELMISPYAVPVSVNGKTWTTPRGKPPQVTSDRSSDIVNPCGLKLSYKTATGEFSGNYTSYRRVGGPKPKFGKTKFKVSGVVVHGVGYGHAEGSDGSVVGVIVGQ